MKRKIIKIDKDKCNGCGLCVSACHEGAIGIIYGKAKLLREDYCDGLGDCLPACPTGAITFEEREAAAYNEEAVKANILKNQSSKPLPCGCPGTHVKTLHSKEEKQISPAISDKPSSQLKQWPVQIKLVPVNAPYFQDAHLLIAADCTAYAYGAFHSDFIKGKITLIGCPKLDMEDYSDKLAEIIKNNSIKSVTIIRMEVPCCAGLETMVKQALSNAGKMIPWGVKIITVDGNIQED